MTRTEAFEIRRRIERAAQHVPEVEAYDVSWMYPPWTPDGSFTAGQIWQYRDRLWRCRQNHDGQTAYAPSVDTAALWELIPMPGEDGTSGKPIFYCPGMALEEGKYYAQDGVIYLCIRDTVNPVYNALADLVGIYVETASNVG